MPEFEPPHIAVDLPNSARNAHIGGDAFSAASKMHPTIDPLDPLRPARDPYFSLNIHKNLIKPLGLAGLGLAGIGGASYAAQPLFNATNNWYQRQAGKMDEKKLYGKELGKELEIMNSAAAGFRQGIDSIPKLKQDWIDEQLKKDALVKAVNGNITPDLRTLQLDREVTFDEFKSKFDAVMNASKAIATPRASNSETLSHILMSPTKPDTAATPAAQPTPAPAIPAPIYQDEPTAPSSASAGIDFSKL